VPAAQDAVISLCGVVVAGFARRCGWAKSSFQGVDIARLGSHIQFAHFNLHFVCRFLVLGGFFPDFWLGASLTFVCALAKGGPRQFGQRQRHIGIFGSGFGVIGHASIGHRTQSAKMCRHHRETRFAVLDRILWLGKLRLSR
jgi:hypothetical protein